MIFEAALLGAAAGLLLGGRLKRLAGIRFRFLPLLLFPVLMSIAPRAPLIGPLLAQGGRAAAYAVALLRYGPLLAFAALNRRNIPILAVGAGALLNFIVTLANGGAMPVLSAAVASGRTGRSTRLLLEGGILTYTLSGAHTRLSFLCDRIVLRGFAPYCLSVGDLVTAAGIFLFLLLGTEPERLRRAASVLRRNRG